jgi:hypothetical protein
MSTLFACITSRRPAVDVIATSFKFKFNVTAVKVAAFA